MVDTWATVGSCAQIGRNVHLSGGAGIGGVLEPLQADPVIIGDGAFIGARAEVAEGVRVGYFGLDADASPSVTPQLRENLSRWISIELAFMARHMPPPRSPQ